MQSAGHRHHNGSSNWGQRCTARGVLSSQGDAPGWRSAKPSSAECRVH